MIQARLDSTHTSLEAALEAGPPCSVRFLRLLNSYPRLHGLGQQMCILSEF